MMLLPASLIALIVLQVSAVPIDQTTCDPTRLSLILNPSWATSPTIHSYCKALFSYDQPTRPDIPSLEVSSNATPTDIRKACECIVAMPEFAPATQHVTQTQHQLQQKVQAIQPQKPRVQTHIAPPVSKPKTATHRPYGPGADAAPRGSELKGFGARDNLYKRGSTLDGVRDRGI